MVGVPGRPRKRPLQMTALGMFVRGHRQVLGLTLERLAKRCGLTYRAVQAIETGDSRLPRPETIRSLARGLGVSVDVLALKVYERPPEDAATAPDDE